MVIVYSLGNIGVMRHVYSRPHPGRRWFSQLVLPVVSTIALIAVSWRPPHGDPAENGERTEEGVTSIILQRWLTLDQVLSFGGTVQQILALSRCAVIVRHWFEIDLDDASMEHGSRIELRELMPQPRRGSESAAQLITADRPLFRADLFDRLTDEPGS